MKTHTAKLLRWLGLIVLAGVCCACSGDADSRKRSYLASAERYFAAEEYEKAGLEVRNALQIDPRFAEGRYFAARVAEQTQDIRAAVGHYRAALDEDPAFSAARTGLARILLFAGALDDASELVETGLAAEPQNAALLTIRGSIRTRQGDLAGGLADAEAAAQVDPDSEDTVALLAAAYARDNRADDAVATVRRAIERRPDTVALRIVLAELLGARGDLDGVEAEFARVIELEPGTLAHRARLARFYVYRGNAAAAEAVWREAVNVDADAFEPKLALVDLLWTQRGEAAGMAEIEAILSAGDTGTDLQIALADYLVKREQLERATAIYDGILAVAGRDPIGLTARNRLASIEAKRGNTDRAQALVEQVLAVNERDNDALTVRAGIALAGGQTAQAIADLRAVLRDQPNAPGLMRVLAQAHLQDNDAALAEDTLRSGVQANPADVPLRLALAQLLLRQSKADQAVALLEPLASTPAGQSELGVLDTLFQAQLATRSFAAAADTARKIQLAEPSRGIGWHYAGLAAEAQEQRDDARLAYEQALEKQPTLVEPLAALVRLDVAAQDPAGALERVDRAIAAAPGHVPAQNMRGELLLAQQQHDAAAESFEQAIAAAPTWWLPYRGLALTHLTRQDFEGAVAAFERGIERTGNDTLGLELASLLERRGDTDAAIDLYEKLVAKQPKLVAAANNLAMLLLNHRGGVAANSSRLTELDAALAASAAPAVLDTRGWIKYKRGDIDAALPLLEQAVADQGSTAEMRYHLGMAVLRNGDKTRARDLLQAAVGSGSRFVGLDEAQSALDELVAAAD